MNEILHPGFDKPEEYETFTTTNGLEEAARHSEILTYPMPEDGDIEKVFKVQEARVFHEIGFIAGAKWDREQMLKEAVDGEIIKDDRGNNVVRAGVFNKDFEYGDKVRVIICKKED